MEIGSYKDFLPESDKFTKWTEGLRRFLAAKSVSAEPLNVVWIEDNFKLVDIGFKVTVLKRDGVEPAKLLIGWKFKPKEDLSENTRRRIENGIREGEFLPYDYRDFICAKVTKIEDARKIVRNMGIASKLLWKGNAEFTDEEMEKIMFQTFLRAFAEGWFGAGLENNDG